MVVLVGEVWDVEAVVVVVVEEEEKEVEGEVVLVQVQAQVQVHVVVEVMQVGTAVEVGADLYGGARVCGVDAQPM